jgi:hypothetical protein
VVLEPLTREISDKSNELLLFIPEETEAHLTPFTSSKSMLIGS